MTFRPLHLISKAKRMQYFEDTSNIEYKFPTEKVAIRYRLVSIRPPQWMLDGVTPYVLVYHIGMEIWLHSSSGGAICKHMWRHHPPTGLSDRRI